MITDLRLQNFRSYRDDSFEFDEGVNIIVGPNASGKTNLMEGVQVLCLGSSYRANDKELVRHKKDWARLDGYTNDQQRSVKIEREQGRESVKKSYVIAEKPYKRLSQAKTVPVVLFEPNHLQLLTGSPERRREFLDDLLEQMVTEFGLVRRQYKRTLQQRNALLKHGFSSDQQLFVWNIRLSELGGKVAGYRQELVQKINNSLQALYRQLSNSSLKVKCSYESSCQADQYGSHMLKKLEASSEEDFRRGFTAYGPHRDDLLVGLGRYPANEVASRGEIRTLLLSIKIVELGLLEEARGQKPVLLLDDVFSELDGARRRALTEFLSGHQTFITTTDADVVVQHFMDKAHIIPLS